MQLGDLTKLIEQGYIEDKCVFEGKDGKYVFDMRTLSPSAENEALKAASAFTDQNEAVFQTTINFLARSISKVNGVPLEDALPSEGATALEKKLSLLKKFSSAMVLALWNKYQEMTKKANPVGSEDEQDQVKK